MSKAREGISIGDNMDGGRTGDGASAGNRLGRPFKFNLRPGHSGKFVADWTRTSTDGILCAAPPTPPPSVHENPSAPALSTTGVFPVASDGTSDVIPVPSDGSGASATTVPEASEIGEKPSSKPRVVKVEEPGIIVAGAPSILIPEQFEANVVEVGRLVEIGDREGAVQRGMKISNPAISYRGVYEETEGKKRHEFMKERENPAIIKYILDEFLTQPKFRKFHSPERRIRVCELGPGMGKDAAYLIRELRKRIIGYHGIDAYPGAVKTTREKLEALRHSDPENLSSLEIGIDEADFMPWMLRGRNYEKEFPPNEMLILLSISTVHYFLRPIFEKVILPILLQMIRNGKGLLGLAMKTPDSPTWLEHEPIFRKDEEAAQGGYLSGVHKTELILRSFLARNTLVGMSDKVGFDVAKRDASGEIMRDENGDIIISANASVESIDVSGYDNLGETEKFTVLVAPAREE